MSAAGDDQPSSSSGRRALVVAPVPAQTGNKRPLSNHSIAIIKIKRECAVALKRRRRGEITYEEFMKIAHSCVERIQARRAATKALCERAMRNEVSSEEFNRECGWSDEDWEKILPDVEKDEEAEAANLSRSHARDLQGRGSKGH